MKISDIVGYILLVLFAAPVLVITLGMIYFLIEPYALHASGILESRKITKKIEENGISKTVKAKNSGSEMTYNSSHVPSGRTDGPRRYGQGSLFEIYLIENNYAYAKCLAIEGLPSNLWGIMLGYCAWIPCSHLDMTEG